MHGRKKRIYMYICKTFLNWQIYRNREYISGCKGVMDGGEAPEEGSGFG